MNMNQPSKNKLSIITPTFNSIKYLPNLVNSLRLQDDPDFEWIICDGLSNDGTLEYVKSLTNFNLTVISSHDFGIYDALNQGISQCASDYYLFVGSDDFLYPNAIANYKQECNGINDIITAPIMIGNKTVYPQKKLQWFYGQHTHISGFSVGCVIRKKLHETFGYYSNKYPIAADQYFILSIIRSNCNLKEINAPAGRFNLNGLSSNDILGSITEFFRIQVRLGSNIELQLLIAMIRILKNSFKISMQAKSLENK